MLKRPRGYIVCRLARHFQPCYNAGSKLWETFTLHLVLGGRGITGILCVAT